MFVFLELRRINRWLRFLQGQYEILSAYLTNIHLILILKIEPSFILSNLSFTARSPFSIWQLLELVSRLEPSCRFIDCIFYQGCDITATIIFCKSGKLFKIVVSERVGVNLHTSFDHSISSFILRKRNIDSSLESPSNGWIKGPWKIGCSQNKNSSLIVSNSLHLN